MSFFFFNDTDPISLLLQFKLLTIISPFFNDLVCNELEIKMCMEVLQIKL